jgi:hypothetical protein
MFSDRVLSRNLGSYGGETKEVRSLDTQKLHQQPKHTTPRLRNSKIHATKKEIGEKRNSTENNHQTNLNTGR